MSASINILVGVMCGRETSGLLLYQLSSISLSIMENNMDSTSISNAQTVSAANLPLEILDIIFSQLDCKTFYLARGVCKWWYHSSNSTVTLRRQLEKLPFRPSVATKNVPHEELRLALNKAANDLMFGLRINPITTHHRSSSCLVGIEDVRTVRHANGDRIVTVKDRTATLWNVSPPKLVKERYLQEPQDALEHGTESRITSISSHELALSSDSRLLAVAWKKDIRIYDIFENESITSRRISSEAAFCVVGLSFEQDDNVLKLELSSTATIMYLGSPPTNSEKRSHGSVDHWRSKSGLSHVLVDGITLRCKSTDSSLDSLARYAAIQILRLSENGLLLAAQRHGVGQSSRYVLAYLKASRTAVGDSSSALTVEPNSLVELVQLETYLSSRDCIINGSGIGAWARMPSAHPHFHSKFCLSSDGRYLVLAERDKHRIWPSVVTQIYVYRVPIGSMFKSAAVPLEGHEGYSRAMEFRAVEQSRSNAGIAHVLSTPKSISNVARIPVCIGSVEGHVKSLTCTATTLSEEKAYTISAITSESTYAFSVSHREYGTG